MNPSEEMAFSPTPGSLEHLMTTRNVQALSRDPEGTERVADDPEAATPAPRPKELFQRWVFGSVGIQVAVLALLALGGLGVARRLETLASVAADAQRDSAAATRELASLRDEGKALTAQVEYLRQSLVQKTTEDTVFLKTLIARPNIDRALAKTIAVQVHRYAELYRRDPNLVLAIISVESRFDPRAVSSVGAEGLMQVMPHWKKILAIDGDLKDPETSIRYGLQILGFYEEMYKDLTVALTAYNRGPGPIDRAYMKGEDPQNGYAARVLEAYERFKNMAVEGKDLG